MYRDVSVFEFRIQWIGLKINLLESNANTYFKAQRENVLNNAGSSQSGEILLLVTYVKWKCM